jgi:hypothetical protein
LLAVAGLLPKDVVALRVPDLAHPGFVLATFSQEFFVRAVWVSSQEEDSTERSPPVALVDSGVGC